ncbi:MULTISPECIES: serine/threonine-protein kinase [unclassified Streptomyces]|uniref:serine/threonine-protein kinase n=1 Tax=unclassified Streptomyces TaxID=2593676 RepID=UPI00203655E8|nr:MULTISPECIES: serine/threonine-protein kinase [unclassified Streptomyces]
MSDQRQPMSPHGAASGDVGLHQLKEAGASPLRPADPGRIGPYVPLGLLGSGGMGHVYLARPADNSPGLAAVKVIRPEYAEDARFRRRFEREAAVHAQVHTPRTPDLLGTGFDDSLLWMATQYLPGLDLAEAVRECGTLGAAGVWRLVAELGQALSALAAAGVVHRDLKPSNVILSLQGAYVIDFGIAQAADSSAITTTGSRVGTPAFMSPEYLREGSCDTASDVFSLAGSLIYAATGHAPFGDGTGVDVMHRVAFEAPKPEIMAELTAVDPALAALMSSCLAKEPAGRPTPRQLLDAATAAGHSRTAAWHEPLGARLLARRQACDVLESVAVQETVHLRAPDRAAFPAPGPAFGTPTPPMPPGQYPTPAQPPVPQDGGRRRKRKAYLALAAGLAVCAVAAGTFFLTRPSLEASASAAPTAAGSTTAGGAQAAPLPSTSASPSGTKDKEEKGKEKRGKEKAASKTEAAETSENPNTSEGGASGTRPTSSDDSDPSDGDETGGSGGAPTATPTETATTPATPPWISQCTYYSGTELTDYGDKGQRVVQVQCMLTKRGYSVGGAGVDGDFGKDTESAVKQFQSAKGLEVDGQVGPNTWAALRSST